MKKFDRNNHRILVVDDDTTSGLMLEAILKKANYTLKRVESGPECLLELNEFQPNLILLDILMPEMDGYETLEKIRKNPEFESTPVIFLTGQNETASKVKGFELGAVDYIIKPFETLEVLARIKVHMRLANALQQLIDLQIEISKQITEGQRSLLVKENEVEGANFSVEYIPLHQAGGDMYEVLKLSDETYVYFVADIAGHSIKTAYLTASIKSLLHQNCEIGHSAQESLRIINQILCETLKPGQYMTACFCMLDYLKMEIEVINLGHPPLLYLPKNGKPELIESEGDVLGAFKNAIWESKKIKINSGDRFVLYTDGLLESHGGVWSSSTQQLIELSPHFENSTLSKLPAAIQNQLLSTHKLSDDLVILAVEVENRQADSGYSSLNAEFQSDRDNISVAVKKVFTFVKSRVGGLNEFEFKLILHEVFTNAVIHGNRDQIEKIFKFKCVIEGSFFELVVQDEGKGFDWRFQIQKSNENIDISETHGRGLLLMKVYGFDYEFNELGNQITISKKFSF